VKDSGYEGYIGIEYEGVEKPEHEGILITRALIEKAWAGLP
jgi:L-ribulose-5-phosphate 3-epimerase